MIVAGLTTYIAYISNQFELGTDESSDTMSRTFVLAAWLGDYAVKCSQIDRIPPPTRIALQQQLTAW